MSEPAYESILYETEDPVATITFNRPDRLNAITGAMLIEMAHAIERAEKDPAVVGIVLTGAGRGFCAGADMEMLKATSEGEGGSAPGWDGPPPEPGDPEMGADFRVGYGYLLSVKKPLLAAVNGPCAGLGFVIAMLCDMRFAAEDAVFTTAFANRGLIAEHGISWILPRLIGPSHALDLLWSGRKFQADEALRLGVVNQVHPTAEVLEKTQDYVRLLAQTSAPNSLRIIKQQIYKHLTERLGPSIEESNRLMRESLERDDFKEGVASFLERRPPRFERVSG